MAGRFGGGRISRAPLKRIGAQLDSKKRRSALRLRGGYYGRYQYFTMSEFAEYLTSFVTPGGEPTRYVVDRTGLKGAYDFTLKLILAGSQ
jgi:uncharacterized protein (TIGR03435 family)